jgi:hypothetical protein
MTHSITNRYLGKKNDFVKFGRFFDVFLDGKASLAVLLVVSHLNELHRGFDRKKILD